MRKRVSAFAIEPTAVCLFWSDQGFGLPVRLEVALDSRTRFTAGGVLSHEQNSGAS